MKNQNIKNIFNKKKRYLINENEDDESEYDLSNRTFSKYYFSNIDNTVKIINKKLLSK